MTDIEKETRISNLALSMLVGGDSSALVHQLLQTMSPHELITGLSSWIRMTAGLIRSSQETNFVPKYDINLIRQQFNQRLAAMQKASPDAMLAALNEEQ